MKLLIVCWGGGVGSVGGGGGGVGTPTILFVSNRGAVRDEGTGATSSLLAFTNPAIPKDT